MSLPVLTVKMEPGSELMWDGKPWKILNVGDTNIHMQNRDGGFVGLTPQEFGELLHSGQFRGMQSATNPVLDEQIKQILRSAGPNEMEEAMNRLRCLLPEQYGEPESPRCKRMVDYYRKDYRAAEQLYGMGFLGLYPSTWKRGNRNRKIDPAVLKLIHEVIEDVYLKSHRPKKLAVWGELVLRCEEKLLNVPTRQTFYGEIKRYSAHAVVKARCGDRAAYKHEAYYWRIEVDTPRHGDRPFDVVHIDHTQLDIELVDKRYGEKTTRPWLSIMIDANTRYILAIYLTFDPPSHRSCMMLIRECVRTHMRVPRVVVVDGGSEFKSVHFETLLACLSIMKKTRPAAKARFGSVMERVFETTNTQFIHNLRGNTQATRNPRTCSPSHNPKDLAVWTLADLDEALRDWIENVYSVNPKQVLGISPLKAFQQGLVDFGRREHKQVIYSDEFVIQCLPTTDKKKVKVDPRSGIQVNYSHYWCAEFSDTSLHGRQVPVRYDPWDLSRAYAYVHHRWVLCRSEHADFFSRLSIREMHFATEEALFKLRVYEQVRQGNAANVAKGVRRAKALELALEERRKAMAAQEAQNETAQHSEPEPVAQDDWSDAIEQHTTYGAF
jgi:transposase InsO family protein